MGIIVNSVSDIHKHMLHGNPTRASNGSTNCLSSNLRVKNWSIYALGNIVIYT